jgi:hypothetical protein
MSDRFKINCEISGKMAELQLDIKKIPGESGPCYMVSIDGLFKGYLRKEMSGKLGQLMNTYFTEHEMATINEIITKVSQ